MRVPEGWRETTLGEVAEIIGGSTPSKTEPNYWEGGIVAWATPSDITCLPVGQTRISQTSAKITEKAVENTSVRVLPSGSLLMTSRATIGYTAINTIPMTTNQGFANFLPNEKYNSLFLSYWLTHNRTALERLAGGSTFLEISKKSLRSLEILLPSLSEQRRIAEILSSVDDAIEATQAVIEQTRTVKQGVLSRLLTKGIGHTRFKQTEIGAIPETWQVASLGRIAEFQPGYAFKSSDFAQEGDKLLRGSNVGVGEIIWEESNTKFFSSSRRDEFSDYILSRGNIVVAMDRPFITAGFKAARVTDKDLPGLLLQRVGRFLSSNRCNEDWLWQVVSSGTLRDTLEKRQVGTDLPHISKKDIESCLVALPPIEEQLEVARILSEFDHAIAANVKKLRCYENVRSGLLSDLLTGRKRVPSTLLTSAE